MRLRIVQAFSIENMLQPIDKRQIELDIAIWLCMAKVIQNWRLDIETLDRIGRPLDHQRAHRTRNAKSGSVHCQINVNGSSAEANAIVE